MKGRGQSPYCQPGDPALGLHSPKDGLCDPGPILSLSGPLLLPLSSSRGGCQTCPLLGFSGGWRGRSAHWLHTCWVVSRSGRLWVSGSSRAARSPSTGAAPYSSRVGRHRVHPAAGPEAPGWLPLGPPSGPGPLRSPCPHRCTCEGPYCLPMALASHSGPALLSPERRSGSGWVGMHLGSPETT